MSGRNEGGHRELLEQHLEEQPHHRDFNQAHPAAEATSDRKDCSHRLVDWRLAGARKTWAFCERQEDFIMAPTVQTLVPRRETTAGAQKPRSPNGLVLEAWAQGFLVGSLVIMSAITIANMRKGVLLHKLILLEVCD